MNKQEIIVRLCALCTKVGEEAFHNTVEHDCFCAEKASMKFERVHPEVIAFIENAVSEKLQKVR